MTPSSRIAITIAVSLCAASSNALDLWIPIAAHDRGSSGTVWRTDIAILNPCDNRATVEIIAHSDDGDFAQSFEILPKTQQGFTDVVGQLAPVDTSASLQLRSDSELVISSRTYNLTSEGTFGQSFDGLTIEDGLDEGGVVLLPQLQQNDRFRTNIGVFNMGESNLGVEIRLFDRTGVGVGSFYKVVSPGRAVLDPQSFVSRFARRDIIGGFAEVEVVYGSGGWAFASVVDQRTGDPTTVLPRWVPECSSGIDVLLAGIEGMQVTELATGHAGYRFFELRYTQPVDHSEPDGDVFVQYLTLLHRSAAAPMILNTLGYGADGYSDFRIEPTIMLNANQLRVEHRFFSSSTPSPPDWRHLTIEQAAADHHRIVEAIKPLYAGPWIGTGASKGGMTATYHRRFYPEDVDATIAYVTPLSLGVPDDRYITFLELVGDPQCRDDLREAQREMLSRRGPMLDLAADHYGQLGLTFDRIGGLEPAFESAVIESAFALWQFFGPSFCSQIPDNEASDEILFDFLASSVAFDLASDLFQDLLGPYYFQAASQLGYPALPAAHLEDLLATEWLNLEEGLAPVGSDPVYDPTSMPDIQQWVLGDGNRMLFIYGEVDPWSAGALEVNENRECYRFFVDNAPHSAMIRDLPTDDINLIRDLLEDWIGIRPTKSWDAQPDPDLTRQPDRHPAPVAGAG